MALPATTSDGRCLLSSASVSSGHANGSSGVPVIAVRASVSAGRATGFCTGAESTVTSEGVSTTASAVSSSAGAKASAGTISDGTVPDTVLLELRAGTSASAVPAETICSSMVGTVSSAVMSMLAACSFTAVAVRSGSAARSRPRNTKMPDKTAAAAAKPTAARRHLRATTFLRSRRSSSSLTACQIREGTSSSAS